MIPKCLDKQPRFAVREGFYECDRCETGYSWDRETHSCKSCLDFDAFETGKCTVCTRAIPNNDLSKEHYLCKECENGWFPMANKKDCMEPLENCNFSLEEYEIVPYEEGEKVYECPQCNPGFYWSREDKACSSCEDIHDDCTGCSKYGEECTMCSPSKVPSGDGQTCIDEFDHCV